MTAVQMVAFDLDGTILEEGERIAAECVAAIRRLHARGIRCVINSGRSTDFQVDLLTRLGLLDQFDGLIGDERWIQLVRIEGDGPQLEPMEPWNSETRQQWSSLELAAGRLCRHADQEAHRRGWMTRLNEPAESLRRGLWAVRFETADQALEMFRWLEPQMIEGLAVNCNGGYIHVYDAGRDKGTALATLAEHFAVPSAGVLAFGDNVNDRPMLDGRHGFAAATVANADVEVQQWVRDAGGRIAARRSGLGVADLLGELIGLEATAASRG